MNSENKIQINYMDVASITTKNFSIKKAWSELLTSIHNIYKNFLKSQINPEELRTLLEEETNSSSGVPDVESIESLENEMHRYINEYKIPDGTSLFLEFKRMTAIYLFSVGSQEKSLDILRDIIHVVEQTIENASNLDINMLCVKDCTKLNLASVHFWLGEFNEARQLIEEVVTVYESTDNELYLIKMVNFVSVAFTYLGWTYVKNGQTDDAERAFLHALKVINTVKMHSKTKFKEAHFINTKSKKIFIYGKFQLI